MLYVAAFRFMSKIMLYYFFRFLHTICTNKTKKIRRRNKMDKLTIADKIMETIVNKMAAFVLFAGIPYFLFVLCQFLLW